MRKTFLVEVDVPREILTSEVVDYITTAISCWKGSYERDDPRTAISNVKVNLATDRRVKQLMKEAV
jgi:hypothetical protein